MYKCYVFVTTRKCNCKNRQVDDIKVPREHFGSSLLLWFLVNRSQGIWMSSAFWLLWRHMKFTHELNKPVVPATGYISIALKSVPRMISNVRNHLPPKYRTPYVSHTVQRHAITCLVFLAHELKGLPIFIISLSLLHLYRSSKHRSLPAL